MVKINMIIHHSYDYIHMSEVQIFNDITGCIYWGLSARDNDLLVFHYLKWMYY